MRRQVVSLWAVNEEEECVQTFGTGLFFSAGSIQISVRQTAIVKRLDPGLSALAQFVKISELNGLGGARLRARGRHVFLQAVVAESAFPGAAIVFAAINDTEGAVDNAIAATVADIGLNENGTKLGADDRAGGTTIETASASTVLANIGREQPGEGTVLVFVQCHGAFDERHVPPCGIPKMKGIVVRMAAEVIAVFRQLIPLLAGDFAGFAADAESSVGKETFGQRLFPLLRPGSIIPVSAFDSWIDTLGSATKPIKSLAASPLTRPRLDQ